MAHLTIRNPQLFAAQVTRDTSEITDAFCQIWPIAHEALLMLQQLAPALGTIGRVAVLAIGMVVTLGGAVAAALCQEPDGDAERSLYVTPVGAVDQVDQVDGDPAV